VRGFKRSVLCVGLAAVLAGAGLNRAHAQTGARPIRIGITISLTGALADAIKPTQYADELWEKQVNARGGLLGRKVELSFFDNKSNPDTGVSLFEKMLQENFDFTFEDSGALLVQRESTLAEQRKRLFLAPNGFARSLYERGYRYLFYTGAAVSEDLNIGLARLLASIPDAQRPKTVGYVTLENIAFTSIIRGTQELLKPLGMTGVVDLSYPTSLNDATPIVVNLKQRGPDLVMQSGLYNDTVLFARAAAQQELKAKLFAIGLVAGAQPNFVPAVGPSTVEGMVYAAGWDGRLKTFQNAEFVKAYLEAKGFDPTYNAAQGYARWQIFEQAVTATGSLDQEVLREYIANNSFRTIQGDFRYNAKGYRTPEDTIVTQFQGGRRVIVWPKSESTGSLVYPRN